MIYEAKTVEEYIEQIPTEQLESFNKLRETLLKNIPDGIVEVINNKMPSYVVPHSIYPNGYHCKPEEPLPFISIASQKNFIALYHMGIYIDPKLLEWFKLEYAKLNIGKLNMGKSCIRFNNMKKIPYALIAELCGKMNVEKWIILYELSRESH